MDNHFPALDATFHGLAHPTRRAVINHLIKGPRAVKDLAAPFSMGLPSFMKHLRVLEEDGLITSEKIGRVRMCRINATRLADAEVWLNAQRKLWLASADRLAHYVETELGGSVEHDD